MIVDEHVRELERRLHAGEAFPLIEDWVEDIPVAEDLKAALWLLAWSEQERGTQRRVAREALAHLGAAAG